MISCNGKMSLQTSGRACMPLRDLIIHKLLINLYVGWRPFHLLGTTEGSLLKLDE